MKKKNFFSGLASLQELSLHNNKITSIGKRESCGLQRHVSESLDILKPKVTLGIAYIET
jgi:Leucine-rich repeat (LRR) protein